MREARWYRQLSIYQSTMEPLGKVMLATDSKEMRDLEQQGMLRYFQFAVVAAVGVLTDYFREQGKANLNQPKAVIREAARIGLIADDQPWSEMLFSINAISAQNDPLLVRETVEQIKSWYFNILQQFLHKMQGLRSGEQQGLF